LFLSPVYAKIMFMMNSNPLPTRRGRRILICVRGNCAAPDQGKQLEQRLADLIEQHGLDDPEHDHHTKCTITNCLGVCEEGPIIMVHPEGIRYHHVDQAALERIFEEHLLQDTPVEDLIRRDQPTHSVRVGRNTRLGPTVAKRKR